MRSEAEVVAMRDWFSSLAATLRADGIEGRHIEEFESGAGMLDWVLNEN